MAVNNVPGMKETTNSKIMMASDYQEGAYPSILKRMQETNCEPMPGYGLDAICMAAKDKIRQACGCPKAEVEFLVGGTQTNAVVIDTFLASYQGVISADSGHVNVHEAGAIEMGGHAVLPLPGKFGKITAGQIRDRLLKYEEDGNRDHMIMPGMVYLSQPTEYGTLYSKEELTEISAVCHEFHIPLYLDGARMAYALAAPENDVTLADCARLCDAFYIGGTKCGALFGEAVVIPDPERIAHFFTIIKQHGALLAKGWLLGIQFNELFKDDLYFHIGESADAFARQIKEALRSAGFPLLFDSPTNQVFFIIDNARMKKLAEKAEFAYGERYDENHTVVRFATSWSTTKDEVDRLCGIIKELA